jgi:hypothetical protein
MEIDDEYMNRAGISSIFARQDENESMAAVYKEHVDEPMIDTSDEPQLPYKLTITEYQEIA